MTEMAPLALPTPVSRLRRHRRVLLLAVIPAVAILAGGTGWLLSGGSVSTDDAYVKADKIVIVPRVSGKVVEVAVAENQSVAKGDLLFRIDPEPYRLALAHAEAELDGTRYDIDGLKATYRQKQAELHAAENTAAYWNHEFERQQSLVGQHVVSDNKVDEVRHQMDQARSQVVSLHQAMDTTLAALGGDADRPTEQHPKVRAALAQRDRAALELSYTEVTAPTDAFIAHEDLNPGAWLSAGSPAFAVVGRDRNWVEANFKETDLTEMRIGQPAEVTVDTYPGHVFHAHVTSIAPATGAEFSLLPPQNASGNWVKVVQRIPVRVAIDPDPRNPALRSGMSAVVDITTGQHHSVTALLGPSAAQAREAESAAR